MQHSFSPRFPEVAVSLPFYSDRGWVGMTSLRKKQKRWEGAKKGLLCTQGAETEIEQTSVRACCDQDP